MRITQIKQQVKHTNRYSVFVDNRYSFSLSDQQLSDLKIKVDQEITKTELSDLQKKYQDSKAYNQTLRLLSYRSRSQWEIADYLKRKGYEQTTIDDVTEKLIEIGLVDDHKFAKDWAENRANIKNSSTYQIKSELLQKKVDKEIIEQVFAELDLSDDAIIKELIEKKRRQGRYKDDLKLMQFLSRRGYRYDVIKSALEQED